MLSNGAFFTECYALQRETNRKHGIDETNTVSAHRKPARRAPHTNNTHTSYQTPLAVGEQTREYCLHCTRHFDRLALRPIEAGAPQNWGSLSTTSRMKDPQSWGESVSISKSYDRNKPSPLWFCIKKFALLSRLFLACIDEFFDSLFSFG